MAATVFTSRVTRAGGFMVSEANGFRSRETVTVASGQVLLAGAVIGKITASGLMKEYNPGNTDGSEVAYGILWDDIDATAGNTKGAAVVRDAEVNQGELTWFSGASGGQITAGIASLALRSIIARPSVPA